MGAKPSVIQKPLSGRDFAERQSLNGDVDDWLKSKKINDQKRLGFNNQYWCIRDKCYDLTNFMEQHPGGKQWLDITKGMDCTGVFETHHINIQHAESLLSKYYVTKIKNTPNTHAFDWNQDTSHYHKLRTQIYNKLLHNQTHNSASRKWNRTEYKLHILSFCALCIWLISFYFLVCSPSIFRALCAGICLHPLIGVGHNFLHQAQNKGFWGMETYWRYIVNLTMYDLYEFRVHHAISHHLFINLDSDLEVSAVEPILNFMANQQTNFLIVYIYAPVFMFALPGLLWLQRIVLDVIKVRWVWNHHLPLIEWLVLWYFNMNSEQHTFWALLWLFYVMHGVTFFIVVTVAFPIHRSDYCWTEGERKGTKDFVAHVLLSTVDYYVDCGMIVSLFGFEMFNDHRIHHLFPTLDLSKVEQIRPVFVEYCKQHGLNQEFRQNSYGLGQIFVGMLRNWYRVYEL